MTEASAPGKLVICGEYAVLCGAPAIAMAVGVRARARVVAGGDVGRLTVVGAGNWPFEWSPRGGVSWTGTAPGEQGRILEAVAETLADSASGLPPRLAIELDTRDFQAPIAGGGHAKLGLGSSAAVTVALVAALLRAAGREVASAALHDVCVAAHRRFQRGSGSGIDVAVAVHGGVVTLSSVEAGVRSLAWPAGLHWLAAWSGSSASTVALLARFEAFRAADPHRFERQLRVLQDTATAAVQAWERRAIDELLHRLDDYDHGLRALDESAGIGIYTPAHAQLARVARSAGAVYKVSGAGGGDFGIAFADSAAVIARVRREFEERGLRVMSGDARVPGVAIA